MIPMIWGWVWGLAGYIVGTWLASRKGWWLDNIRFWITIVLSWSASVAIAVVLMKAWQALV